MAILQYSDIGIRAVAACVPEKIVPNSSLSPLLPAEELEKTINLIGIREKRYAAADVCASDLCFKAAQQLISDNNVDISTIDALIFLSQTPDYHQPATAPSLAHRLGLSSSTLSFDVNLACSGYVYGLSIAYAFAANLGVRKVLFLTGETMSKTISQKDKVTAPLFGDAGSATLVEKGDFGETTFSLNSDGSRAEILNMPYGGYRHPSSPEGFAETTDGEGNTRTGEHLKMDGMDVFNFGIRAVPGDIQKLLKHLGKTVDDMDILLYHQANKFMTDFFTKHLKFDTAKTPYSLDRFGNTSSASIPLTIVSEMADPARYPKRDHVMMTGFGAGLSWGSVFTSLSACRISKLVEY